MRRSLIFALVAVLLLSIGYPTFDARKFSGHLPEFDAPNTAAITDSVDHREVVQGDDREPVPESFEKCQPGASLLEQLEQQTSSDELEAVSALLSASNDPEMMLAAYLLNPASGSEFEAEASDRMLNAASNVDPENKLIIWNRLQRCFETDCPYEDVRVAAIEADSANGAVWTLLAAQELERGRVDQAFETLMSAAAAPTFDTYWMEHVGLMERAFSATTDWLEPERAFRAIGIVAAMPIAVGPIFDYCRNPGENEERWAELCDQLGQKMAIDGQTTMTQIMGHALRVRAGELVGDPERTAEAESRLAKMRREYMALSNRRGQNLMGNDAKVFRSYLQDFATYGEFEALVRLNKEADRLAALPDYDQCNFANQYGL